MLTASEQSTAVVRPRVASLCFAVGFTGAIAVLYQQAFEPFFASEVLRI
jgi:hypothetical protein